MEMMSILRTVEINVKDQTQPNGFRKEKAYLIRDIFGLFSEFQKSTSVMNVNWDGVEQQDAARMLMQKFLLDFNTRVGQDLGLIPIEQPMEEAPEKQQAPQMEDDFVDDQVDNDTEDNYEDEEPIKPIQRNVPPPQRQAPLKKKNIMDISPPKRNNSEDDDIIRLD